jgi:hypothetical protein
VSLIGVAQGAVQSPSKVKTPSKTKSATPKQKAAAKEPAERLRDFDDAKEIYVFQKTHWSLAIAYQDKEHPPRLGTSVVDDILAGRVPESKRAYVKKYQLPFVTVLAALGTLGKSLGYYLPLGDDIPTELVLHNGKKCVIVPVGSDMTYNTLRMTGKQRAAKVLVDMVLPKLKDLEEALARTDIEYIAPFIIYGTRDFSEDDSPLNLDPEITAIVASKSDAKSFADSKITDQELVDRSVVILSERKSLDFKRIKVTLE